MAWRRRPRHGLYSSPPDLSSEHELKPGHTPMPDHGVDTPGKYSYFCLYQILDLASGRPGARVRKTAKFEHRLIYEGIGYLLEISSLPQIGYLQSLMDPQLHATRGRFDECKTCRILRRKGIVESKLSLIIETFILFGIL